MFNSYRGHQFTRLRRKPRLPVLRSKLLRRADEAVEECAAGVLYPSARAYGRRAEALAKEDMLPAFVALSATTAE